MTRDINLPFWLTSDGRGRVGRQDRRLLTRLGVTHIRLPFSPERLLFYTGWDPERPIQPELFQEIDDALDLLLGTGFSVTLDMHPRAPFKKLLEDDNAFVERVIELWRALGKHVAKRDPDRLFLEIMNEPDDSFASKRWSAIQRRLARAIRSAAPRHTIIATGPRWGRADALKELALLDDPNVVYAFHFYEPLTFTHQGITWGGGDLRSISGLSYPSDRDGARRLVRRISHPGARRRVRVYGDQEWSARKIDAIIASARAWADEKGVPVVCNEFGVYVGAVSSPLTKLVLADFVRR